MLSEPTEKNALDHESERNEPVKLDEVIKFLFEVSNDLLIPTLNSLFHENFDVESIEIGKTATEVITDNLDILHADVNIKITEDKPKHFHIEIQTEVDVNMGFRSFRYDVLKALDNYVESGMKTGRAVMPKSLIIQIKSGKKIIQDYGSFELEMSDGIVVKYNAPVFKYFEYDKDRLLQENLFLLLPIQVFMLRDTLDRITKSGEPQAIQETILKARTLTENIATEINKLHKDGKISLYDTEKILIALKELFRHLNSRYNKVNTETLNREVDIMVKTLIDDNMRKQLDKAEKKIEQAEQELQKEKVRITEAIREMLLDGEPIEKIIKYTKASKSEIENIQKTL